MFLRFLRLLVVWCGWCCEHHQATATTPLLIPLPSILFCSCPPPLHLRPALPCPWRLPLVACKGWVCECMCQCGGVNMHVQCMCIACGGGGVGGLWGMWMGHGGGCLTPHTSTMAISSVHWWRWGVAAAVGGVAGDGGGGACRCSGLVGARFHARCRPALTQATPMQKAAS